MAFPRVSLLQNPADAGPSVRHDDKQVLSDKTEPRVFVNYFHMGEALDVGADLILALDDINSSWPQHTPRFSGRDKIKIKHRFMVLALGQSFVVPVVIFVILMVGMCASTGRVHIRRVKNNAVYRVGLIRQISAVHAA
ncbi:MAG: hypothetical protein ACLQVA_16880 [Candidatus Brocadiia bacterium]